MQKRNRPEGITKKPLNKRVRQCVAGVLACVMALGTTFSLAPDAFAQEAEQKEASAYTCGLEAHTHTEECYEKVTTVRKQVLSCSLTSQPDMAAESSAVTILHKHDAGCYGADGTLLCTLTEREAHTHEDACHAASSLHTHGPECYETFETMVCGKEEVQGHTHCEECSGRTLTCEIHVCTAECGEACGLKPEEAHAHGEGCYQENTCDLEETEGHTHTDECCRQLKCTLPEGEVHLVCGKEEWIPHTHTEECQAEAACEKQEVVEHVHTEACFVTAEEAAEDPEQLTCGREENEEHQHTALCRGTWELTCGLEEHSHEDCMEAELDTTAEAFFPENLNALSSSGYYEYWAQYGDDAAAQEAAAAGQYITSAGSWSRSLPASSVQIGNKGGESKPEGANAGDQVTISKTIAGTALENVFDITLTVETKENMERFASKPDIDVVLVIDASGSMTENISYNGGYTAKYSAATTAASQFVKEFKNIASDSSRIGCVAFNTNAATIQAMQSVKGLNVSNYNTQMGNKIESLVKSGQTNGSTNGNGYTNIQGGLIAAQNLLAGSTAPNRFVVFLSDGLPTTYSNNWSTTGYSPKTESGTKNTDGTFYDRINSRYCPYGTNYSDKGAKYAEQAADKLTAAGVKIYPVGVGIESFTTYNYSTTDPDDTATYDAVGYIKNQLVRGAKYGVSTVDNYIKREDGMSLNDAAAKLRVVGYSGGFSGWLRSEIGNTNWFYNCKDQEGLTGQFKTILDMIVESSRGNSANAWTVTDTIPSDLEYIAFVANGMANDISCTNGTIDWDLRESQYDKVTTEAGSTTTKTYTYTATYRVRLKNEANGFVENVLKNTNTNAKLTYNTAIKDGNNISYSGEKTLDFQIPSVEGYLAELSFTKEDDSGKPISGAVFTLYHSADCNVCRGDNESAVDIADRTATSGADGSVSFTGIPSGHIYTLEETTIPNGYKGNSDTYIVTVAYDEVTIEGVEDPNQFTVTNEELTATVGIEGTKTLTNHDQGTHTYSFRLEEVDASGAVLENGTTATTTVTFDADTTGNSQSFNLGNLTFRGSELGAEASRTYYYRISETTASSDSLKADDSYYIATVVVALNDSKTDLTATTTINKYNSAGKHQGICSSITFTNTLLGELRITKQAELHSSTSLQPGHVFEIAVKKNGSALTAGTQYKVGDTVKTVEADGVIRLAAGETAVLEGLTVGDIYEIEEIAASAYGFTVSYDPASVKITEKTEASPYVSLSVINTEQTAALTLEGTKLIANPDDAEHEYTFRLQPVDEAGNPDGDPVTQTVKVTESGTFQFPITYTGAMLMGESAREFYYRITEVTPSDLTVQTDPAVYLVTVELKSENDQLTASAAYQKLVNGEETDETAVTFTNTLLGSLTLKKQIVGEYPEGETFSFTISGLPDGSYTADLNGEAMQITVQDNTCTVELTHKDALVIYGIPHGTELTITEVKTDYTAYYVVNSGWRKKGNSVSVDVSTSGTEVLFKNYSSKGLPQTGQLNWPISVLTILGIACIGSSFILMGRRKGRYEK